MSRHTLIGTAGHVDHGKTTLISSLTGIDAGRIDRLAEEKKRGITIDLGYAFLPLPNGGVASIIDVPGHEKFIKNMLAGAGGIDLVLLVIAVDDGVMPQTREHLSILQLLGARDGIIVLTKCDIPFADALPDEQEWRAMVREDIRETVTDTFLSSAPIIEVSAHTGVGMDILRALIYKKAATSPYSASGKIPQVECDSLQHEILEVECDSPQHEILEIECNSLKYEIPEVEYNSLQHEKNAAHGKDASMVGTDGAAFPSGTVITPFRLPIDRVFIVDGFGTVATGTLTEGTIRIGDTAEILPAGRIAKVRNLQVHGGDAAVAYAGQRVAVNLSGVQRGDLARGDVLAAPGTLHPTRMLDVRLSVLRDTPRTLRTGSRLHFHYGTHSVLCKAVLIGRDTVKAGEECFAQLRFTENVAVKEGDRFVVRFYSPVETVGGGIVLHTTPTLHRKNRTAQTIERLQRREQTTQTNDPAARLLQAIADASPLLTPLSEIVKKLNYDTTPNIFETTLTALEAAGKITRIGITHAIDDTYRATLATHLEKTLAAFHRSNPLQTGIRKEELRSRILPDAKPALFDAVLTIYEKTQKEDAPSKLENVISNAEPRIRITNNRVALAGFAVTYTPIQQKIRENILTNLTANPYMPPTPEELLAPHKKNAPVFIQVLEALQTDGTLITTEPGIIFTTQAVEEAKNRFRTLAKNTTTDTHSPATDTQNLTTATHSPAADTQNPTTVITLATFRDALATSRKYALSLLEYFDRTGFTRKDGDARIIRNIKEFQQQL